MKPVVALALTAAVSAGLSVGCLAGAYSLANVNDSGSSVIITREIPWDGSAGASLGLPAVMRYVQAPGPGKILARGPHRSVSTLKVAEGTIRDTLLHTGAVLDITLMAPSVSSFYLNGRSRLIIETFDQESLTLFTEGEAAVEANGRAQNVRILMQGDGAINLVRLGMGVLDADITGASTLVAAPQQRASLNVTGAASAVLLSRPPDLNVNQEDGGRIIDASPASSL